MSTPTNKTNKTNNKDNDNGWVEREPTVRHEVDTPGLTPQEKRARARRVARENDNLGLLTGDPKKEMEAYKLALTELTVGESRTIKLTMRIKGKADVKTRGQNEMWLYWLQVDVKKAMTLSRPSILNFKGERPAGKRREMTIRTYSRPSPSGTTVTVQYTSTIGDGERARTETVIVDINCTDELTYEVARRVSDEVTGQLDELLDRDAYHNATQENTYRGRQAISSGADHRLAPTENDKGQIAEIRIVDRDVPKVDDVNDAENTALNNNEGQPWQSRTDAGYQRGKVTLRPRTDMGFFSRSEAVPPKRRAKSEKGDMVTEVSVEVALGGGHNAGQEGTTGKATMTSTSGRKLKASQIKTEIKDMVKRTVYYANKEYLEYLTDEEIGRWEDTPKM